MRVRWRVGGLREACLVGLAVAMVFGRAAAEPVTVEVIRDAGIERLRLVWQAPVSFSTAALEGLMTLTFDRPMEADLRPIASLSRLAGPPRLSEDRRILRLPLVAEAGALAYADDRIVFIDLLPAAPPQPTEVAKMPPPAEGRNGSAPPAEPVAVRFGEHGHFSRVVFDWAGEVGYRLERDGAVATITFDRPARFDLAKAGRRPPRLREAKPAAGEASVRLTLADPSFSMRDFRLGTKVVIDVAGSELAVVATQPSPEREQNTAAPAPAPPPLPVARPVMVASPAPASGVAPTAAVTPATASTAEGLPPVTSITSPAVEPAPSPLPANPPAAAVPPPKATAAALPSLRFDWREAVAASVFRRGDRVWIVFDAPFERDVATLVAATGGAVRGLRQLAAETATVLQVQAPALTTPSVSRDGNAWIVSFTATPPSPPPEPLVPMPEPQAAGGPRLVVPVVGAGRPVIIGDPDVGDTLFIVPTIPLGRGINRHFRYPMVELLPTVQGVVVQPLIDSLEVATSGAQVVISSRAGMILSPLPEQMRAGTRLGPPGDVRPTLDLKRWADLRPAEFSSRRQALTREVAFAEGADRIAARQALGEFYLSQGLANEAQGEAAVIASLDKEAAAQAPVRLLTGAALLTQGRVGEAGRVLAETCLDGLDEAALWRSAAAAAAGGPPAAPPAFDRHSALLLAYPLALRRLLMPLMIEAAMTSQQLETAQLLLAAARADEPPPQEMALLDVIDGRIRLARGDQGGAREAFARAAAGPSPKAEALAKVELVALDLKSGAATPADAIERLDALRFLWRGDAIEANLLLRLSELCVETGDYGRALATLRQVVGNFRGRPEATIAADRMAALFQSIFVSDRPPPLSPLAAVALYNEFRELTPPGEKGQRILLGLAERLLALDLPGSAATLLEPAASSAREPLARVELGTALARAEDQAGRPEAVLKALAASRADDVPAGLLVTRRRLEAKALVELGRHDEAMSVLAQLSGREAAALRAQIYRRKGDWAAASRLLAEPLGAEARGVSVANGDGRNGEATASPPPPAASLEVDVMRLLGDESLAAARDRASLDRAVEEAVRVRDALKAIAEEGAKP
jgi:hypothetical protein